ncbi:MAG TPA: hypothetical protein VKM93_26805 [Terriglobia bacterium]|nr:hypothetical protein [Terriglobia bacterium]
MKALEKANAAPPEKRNQFTPRRQLAWYANLSLAHLKLGPPGKRSPTHTYNGTSCRHLENSLALAGEDKAKPEAHREKTAILRRSPMAGGTKVGIRNPKLNPGGEFRISSFEFRLPSNRQFPRSLWARLMVFLRWLDSEALELDETLEQASGPQEVDTWDPKLPAGPTPKSGWRLELEDESPHWQWRALAALLLAVFAKEMVLLTQAAVLAEGRQRALCLPIPPTVPVLGIAAGF